MGRFSGLGSLAEWRQEAEQWCAYLVLCLLTVDLTGQVASSSCRLAVPPQWAVPLKGNELPAALVRVFFSQPEKKKLRHSTSPLCVCIRAPDQNLEWHRVRDHHRFIHCGPCSSPTTQTPSAGWISLALPQCFVNEWTDGGRIIKPNEVEFNPPA